MPTLRLPGVSEALGEFHHLVNGGSGNSVGETAVARVLRALADGDTDSAAMLTPAIEDHALRGHLAAIIGRSRKDAAAIAEARAALEDRVLTEWFRDGATGLRNHRALIQRLDHIAVRRPLHPVVVVVVEVVGMKGFNDHHGNPAGDEILRRLATNLSAAARGAGRVHRTGGAQFACVFERADAVSAADVFAREAVEMPTQVAPDFETSFGLAVGVAAGAAEGNGDLFHHAAAAAGDAGVGEIHTFDAQRDAYVQRRRRLEYDIRRAVELDQLRLVYQPEVDLATGGIAMAEALLRWEHPFEGDVPPGEFIPMAERTGAITSIGDWVLEAACADAVAFAAAASGPPRLAVNLSGAQLRDAGFSSRMRSIVGNSGIAASALCLEVTETVMVSDSCDVSVLGEMRENGAHVAIDDFGTGYSSLAYLKRLPIDVLKIDQSFVAGLGDDDDDATIVRAIIRLGRALGLSVVAEGVETAAQASALQRYGCDIAQGYAVGRPMKASALTSWSVARATDVIDLRSPLTAR